MTTWERKVLGRAVESQKKKKKKKRGGGGGGGGDYIIYVFFKVTVHQFQFGKKCKYVF